MKYLLIALLFITSSALAGINDPPASAVCAADQGTTVYGYNVCVWPTFGAGGVTDEYGLRAAYFDNGAWIYLAERTHFISNFTNEVSTDQYFATFVDAINEAIETELAPFGGGNEPVSGIARIQWLAGNIVFSNNAVTF